MRAVHRSHKVERAKRELSGKKTSLPGRREVRQKVSKAILPPAIVNEEGNRLTSVETTSRPERDINSQDTSRSSSSSPHSNGEVIPKLGVGVCHSALADQPHQAYLLEHC